MKILVTGAAGFIGSNISERLLKEGYGVIGVDINNNNLAKFNLSFSDRFKKFKYKKINILDKKAVFSLIEEIKPDFLIHCAAKAGVRKSLKNPLIYAETNIIGTQNLLEGLRLYSQKTKSIILSSSSVYGLQEKNYFSEDMIPNPQSVYGVSKYTMELIAKQYYDFYKLPLIIVRPFSVFGPRGRLDMAPFLILKAAEKNETFIKFGNNKNNKRDWTFIDNFVNGILLMIKKKDFVEFEIINLGNGKPIGIDDFISIEKEFIKKYVGKKIKIKKGIRKKEELPLTSANLNKAISMFKYKPEINFEQGMIKFFEYYIKYRKFYIKLYEKI